MLAFACTEADGSALTYASALESDSLASACVGAESFALAHACVLEGVAGTGAAKTAGGGKARASDCTRSLNKTGWGKENVASCKRVDV